MSETKEGIFYDLFDFSKSVYLFSHMKTNLVDSSVQIAEITAITFLMVITNIIFILVLFKTLIILGYFLCSQALTAFVRFVKALFKTKFNVSFKSSFKNSLMFFWRVFKKIYTFNFYLFYTKLISAFMIISFWICIFSNFQFNRINKNYIEEPEKGNDFLLYFFLSFQFNLLMEIICSIFYSSRKSISSSLLSFGYYVVINVIIIIVFLLVRRREYLKGAYLFEEPQRKLNIIIYSILFILKLNALYRIIKFNKRSKFIFYVFNV